jgi:hypothetical protein
MGKKIVKTEFFEVLGYCHPDVNIYIAHVGVRFLNMRLLWEVKDFKSIAEAILFCDHSFMALSNTKKFLQKLG